MEKITTNSDTKKRVGKKRSEGSGGIDGLTNKKRSGGAHSSVGSTPNGGEKNNKKSKKVKISEESGAESCSSRNVIKEESEFRYSKSTILTPEPSLGEGDDSSGSGSNGSGTSDNKNLQPRSNAWSRPFSSQEGINLTGVTSGSSLLQRSSTAPCGCYTGQTCPDPKCVNRGARMRRHDLRSPEEIVDCLFPPGSIEAFTPPRLPRELKCPDAPRGGWDYPSDVRVEENDTSAASLLLSMNNNFPPQRFVCCETFLEQSTNGQDMRPIVLNGINGQKSIIVADGHGGRNCVNHLEKNSRYYCQLALGYGAQYALNRIIADCKIFNDGAMVLVAVLDKESLTISSYGDCSAWVIIEGRNCYCHPKHDQEYAEQLIDELTANGVDQITRGYLHPKPLAGYEFRNNKFVPAFDRSDFHKSVRGVEGYQNKFFRSGSYVVATPASVGNLGKFNFLLPITRKVKLPFGKKIRVVIATDGVLDVVHEQDPLFMKDTFPNADSIINLVKKRANYLYGGKPGDDISGVVFDINWLRPMTSAKF